MPAKKKTTTSRRKKSTKKKAVVPGNKRRVASRRVHQETSPLLPTVKEKRGVCFEDYIHMFFGPPGIGKTTFVNNLDDNILFLSTDRGTRFLEALAVECNKWNDFEKILIKLEKQHKDKKMQYSAICIDHVADWAEMAEVAILEELEIKALTDAGYGKGWSMYKKLLNRYMQRLRALDLGLIFIAHEEIKTVKVRGVDVDKVMPKMSKQAWDALIPVCDLVGFCEMRRIKVKGEKRAIQIRTLTTEPRDELYAKDRTDRTKPKGGKDYIKLDGQAFMATFK